MATTSSGENAISGSAVKSLRNCSSLVKSKMPERMPRSWRMVILSPLGMPSIQVASVSSSLSLPWSTRRSVATATKVFVMLAMRKWSSTFIGVFEAMSLDAEGADEFAAAGNPDADIEAGLALARHAVLDDLDDRGFLLRGEGFGGRAGATASVRRPTARPRFGSTTKTRDVASFRSDRDAPSGSRGTGPDRGSCASSRKISVAAIEELVDWLPQITNVASASGR